MLLKSCSWQFLPCDPARAGGRIGARALDCHAVALGVAFDLEGLLVPELDVALALPPAAGCALLVCEVDSLHPVTFPFYGLKQFFLQFSLNKAFISYAFLKSLSIPHPPHKCIINSYFQYSANLK